MILRNPENSLNYEINKLNPYWMELHYFYRQVFKIYKNEELISIYINHFNEISARMIKEFSTTSSTIVSNGLMWDIYNYYEKKGNPTKANEIAKLNNAYPNVWREIPEDED